MRCMSTPFTDCIPCTLLFSIGSNTWQFKVFDGSRQTASLKSDLDNVVAMFFFVDVVVVVVFRFHVQCGLHLKDVLAHWEIPVCSL